MEATLWNRQGEETGKVNLPNELFGVRANVQFLHEIVTRYLANQRRWTANTKTRAEVSGGGHKPWKQKHTGRARAGSNRSPLWRKGGIAFGPRAIDPALKRVDMPRRKARLALTQALSVRAANGGLRIIEALSFENPKTRQMAELLKKLGVDKKPLLVIDHQDRNLKIAGRNIPGLRVALVSNLNAYEILRCGALVMTQTALEKLRSRSN
jgi:large subunit ribosomal protein L4